MRYEGDDNVIFFPVSIPGSEQVSEQRNIRDSGDSGKRAAVAVRCQPAEQADLTVLHPNIGFINLLPDDRLGNARDGLRLHDVRNLHFDVHAYVVGRIHVRRELNLHTDVDLLELRRGVRNRARSRYG